MGTEGIVGSEGEKVRDGIVARVLEEHREQGFGEW